MQYDMLCYIMFIFNLGNKKMEYILFSMFKIKTTSYLNIFYF